MNEPVHTRSSATLVSIAMCTYNGGRFLREQLDSLLAQTYPDIAIVVVDDASTDNTASILNEYAAKDDRLHFFVNETNLGYNRNFEKAIGLCTGNYIAISDQDDIWEATKIETIMEQWPGNSSFVYSLSGNFSGNDFEHREAAPNVMYGNIDDPHKLVFNSPVHGHACMFKKELFERCTLFPPDIFYDWWMSMYAASGGTIGCIPQTLTWHRVHEDNSSRNITSIADTTVREKQLREQCAHFIETFYERNTNDNPQRRSLLQYARLLRALDGKHFSWPMFRYVMKNRKLVFHYKKPKPFIFISILKHAVKMGYRGLL